MGRGNFYLHEEDKSLCQLWAKAADSVSKTRAAEKKAGRNPSKLWKTIHTLFTENKPAPDNYPSGCWGARSQYALRNRWSILSRALTAYGEALASTRAAHAGAELAEQRRLALLGLRGPASTWSIEGKKSLAKCFELLEDTPAWRRKTEARPTNTAREITARGRKRLRPSEADAEAEGTKRKERRKRNKLTEEACTSLPLTFPVSLPLPLPVALPLPLPALPPLPPLSQIFFHPPPNFCR